uniref:Vasoactive intestinal peptide n=1 Tax=Oreochromis niloticus TaxID=8128 RepID=I3KV30_ORENI
YTQLSLHHNRPEQYSHQCSFVSLSCCCCSLCRSSRHADGLFTSGYSRLLSQLTAKDYLESLMEKRVNGDLTENLLPAKRHSDAVFTDSYSRFRKQMAAKKYLNSVLTGTLKISNMTTKVHVI